MNNPHEQKYILYDMLLFCKVAKNWGQIHVLFLPKKDILAVLSGTFIFHLTNKLCHDDIRLWFSLLRVPTVVELYAFWNLRIYSEKSGIISCFDFSVNPFVQNKKLRTFYKLLMSNNLYIFTHLLWLFQV